MAREWIGSGIGPDGMMEMLIHELWNGPWSWELTLPDGTKIKSPETYPSQKLAQSALDDAREQARKGLPAVETVSQLRARAEAAEAEAARLRAVIDKAIRDLPEWSAGALKHLSPAEVMGDSVRMDLRRAVETDK